MKNAIIGIIIVLVVYSLYVTAHHVFIASPTYERRIEKIVTSIRGADASSLSEVVFKPYRSDIVDSEYRNFIRDVRPFLADDITCEHQSDRQYNQIGRKYSVVADLGFRELRNRQLEDGRDINREAKKYRRRHICKDPVDMESHVQIALFSCERYEGNVCAIVFAIEN